MSSIADRNQELLIQRLGSDPRLEGEEVVSAAALMRISIFVTVIAGLVGAILLQAILGQGALQFGIGLALGYAAYFGYLAITMDEPRVIGAIAVLTKKRILLLGSRSKGVVADYPVEEIETLELTRKGNILFMGRMAMTHGDGKRFSFLTTNRRMAQHFVAEFEEMRQRGFR